MRILRQTARFLVPVLIAACPGAAEEITLAAPGSGEWRPLVFHNVEQQTVYTPMSLDGVDGVRAESECSASALAYALDDVDLSKTPRFQWKWRIEDGLDVRDERAQHGDDFAARVYLMFRFRPERASVWERLRHAAISKIHGTDLPGDAINYVWASREATGATWDNPFAKTSKMVSLGSGPLPYWRTEEVNVVADYVASFGHEPPPLLGVALMTDSDNSCQDATAYYADFRFLP